MSILDKFNAILEKQKEKKLEQGVKEVENVYDKTKTEEEGINEAARKVIELIEQDPELAVKVLANIQESEKLPKKVVVEAIKQIPNTEQIEDPEKTIIKTVEELPLQTEDIKSIISQADVSLETAKQMTDQIPNKEARQEEKNRLEQIEKEKLEQKEKEREKEVLKDLRELYAKCDKIEGSDLTEKLSGIKKQEKSQKISEAINQILARKAAIEWTQFGTTRLPSMYTVITPEEMIEIDFPNLVEQEYADIKDKQKYAITKVYEFDKNNLQKLILKGIAKQVSGVHKEYGIIEIPQSVVETTLDGEVEQYFVEKILKYGEDIKDEDMVRNKIRGINNYELEDLIEMIKKLPDSERSDCLKDFKKQIKEIKQKVKDEENSEKLEQNQGKSSKNNINNQYGKNSGNAEEEYTH